MSRSLTDRVERLEDGAVTTGQAVALLQQAQALRLERERDEDLPGRVDRLEADRNKVKGVMWLMGVLFLVLSTIVGVLMSRGWP